MCENGLLLAFHMLGQLYTIDSFLALNCALLLFEAPNVNSTFTFISAVMFLSLVEW